jgi:glycerophosphoryl diester phosphodiesterase
MRRPRGPLVIAHRGNSAAAPEQTLAAFEQAVELGADMIEADVRRSSDGRLVLLHDATLDRTTNGHGRVDAATFDDLRRLDAGAWFDVGQFAGQRIPALDELFELAEAEGIGLCLEVKGDTAEDHASVAQEVARELGRRDRLDADVLASFDHRCLALAAAAVPGLRSAPDRLPERGLADGRALVEQAEAIGARIIQHHHEDLTGAAVDEAHRAGVALWAWPPETAREIERVAKMGVDAVMGDDVALIVSAL